MKLSLGTVIRSEMRFMAHIECMEVEIIRIC